MILWSLCAIKVVLLLLTDPAAYPLWFLTAVPYSIVSCTQYSHPVDVLPSVKLSLQYHLIYLDWSCLLLAGSACYMLAPYLSFHMVDVKCTSLLFGPTGQIINL